MTPKMSGKQAKAEADKIMEEIRKLEAKAKKEKLQVSSLSEDEIVSKLMGYTSHSPFIYSMGWTSGTSPGSPASFAVYFQNPSTDPAISVFASIFFGAGANALPNDLFLQTAARGNFNGDNRWPYMSSSRVSLAPGATGSAQFNYTTPTGVPLTTYIGNVLLWSGSYHDRGVYLDRGVWEIKLS